MCHKLKLRVGFTRWCRWVNWSSSPPVEEKYYRSIRVSESPSMGTEWLLPLCSKQEDTATTNSAWHRSYLHLTRHLKSIMQPIFNPKNQRQADGKIKRVWGLLYKRGEVAIRMGCIFRHLQHTENSTIVSLWSSARRLPWLLFCSQLH